jgi:hypothetical protein
MKVSPNTVKQSPDYPKVNEIKNINLVLNSQKPNSWKRNTAIAAVFASMSLLTLNNCISTSKDLKQKYESLTDSIHFVSPVFEHGQGIGAWGCVMIAPPVFLSEDEARQTIIHEFSNSGIELTSDSTLDKVLYFNKSDKIKSFDNSAKNYYLKDTTISSELKYIAVNKEYNLGVVFIGNYNYNNYKQYDNSNTENTFDGEFQNYKTISRNISNFLTSTKVNVIVLYEPANHYTGKNNVSKSKRKELITDSSKDSIRTQIQDFFKWLKGKSK